MSKPNSALGRSRDIGTGNNGKGDADRVSDVQAFNKNFSGIEWPVLSPDGFEKIGAKQVKTYGAKPKSWVINPAWVAAGPEADIVFPNYDCWDC